MVLYWLLWGCLLTCLGVAAWIDARTQEIPWSLCLAGSAVGVALHGAFQGWLGGLDSLLSCLAWFALAELLWRVAPVGGGDLNLLAMSAAYTGWEGPVLIYLLAVMTQGVVYVVSFARGDMRLARPFAPALFAGAALLLIWQLLTVVPLGR